MIKKFPIHYTEKQMEEAQFYIESTFCSENGGEGMIAHEITSEYVHSDVLVHKNADGKMVYASFGMGAREMNCPREGYERAELVMHASPETEIQTEKNMMLANTIVNMTKYPFLNDTWFGTGHTVDVNSSFRNEFGFDAFALLEMSEPCYMQDLGTVHFLTMIPIYKDERDWIIENGTFEYLELLFEEFGEEALYADKPRAHFVPDEEQTEEVYMRSVMNALGIDEDTFFELQTFLSEQEEKGVEITYEMIGEWIVEHMEK